MQRGQGSRHFQISKAIFMEMDSDPLAGNGHLLLACSGKPR
jgi:hypothetical protein